jgi:predicted nuclease of predicted toxin-antitoxin system
MPWIERTIDDAEAIEFSTEHRKKGRFLVDESLGEEAARVIRSAGWNAVFVSEVNLRGRSDEEVFAFAWSDNRVILTHDRDFLDDRRFPPHRNPGVVVLPGAEGSNAVLEKELARVLITLGSYREAYRGHKIHVRDDGTWAIRSRDCPSGSRGTRLLRFERHGRILEWQGDDVED